MPAVSLPCIGDGPYIAAAGAQSALAVLETWTQIRIQKKLLEWQSDQRTQIADLRQMLADRRMLMAEQVLGHAQIGWNAERSFVNATMGEGRHSPQYAVADASSAAVEEAHQGADAGIDYTLAKYGMAQSECDDQRVSRGMALARTDLISHQFRAAESRAIALNDRRFSRQLTALGMGHDILDQAMTIGQLGAGREIVRQALVGTVNSAMQMWGYASKRWGPSGGWGGGTVSPPQVVPEGSKLYSIPGVAGQRYEKVLPSSVGDILLTPSDPASTSADAWDASSNQG